MSTGMWIALAIFVVVAIVVGAFVIGLIVGPMSRARRERAREGPDPQTDGEPTRAI